MDEQKLRKDVFVALAAIAWADGELHPDEADAIVRAASDEGLSIEEIDEIDRATQQRVDLGAIDLSGMSAEDRLFVYAIATWIARMDGRVTEAESSALERLGKQLGIADRTREQVSSIARKIAEAPEGDRPARYDLTGLRRVLGERLRAARERAKSGA